MDAESWLCGWAETHELRHAYQEAHGWDMCEQEAEYGSERIPF
jgi:hypothetical protein